MTLADCTIMVVEDHEFQRRTTLQILANLGARVLLEAESGARALELMAGDPRPDIVVCDLDMPGMDGVEFLRHVSELGAGTAIVIASGLDDSVLRSAEATARRYGLEVLGAIRKPLTARLLLQAVGLHQPGSAAAPAAAPATSDDPWAAALDDDRVAVRVRPRVELSSGHLGAVEVRAHRIEENGAKVDAANDPRGPAEGDVADAIADLVAWAGLAVQRRLSDSGNAVDVAIVLPPAALAGEQIVERLAGLAADAGVDLGRVCIALPDARGSSPAAAPLDVLTRLRVRGFGLGIDGFGAAHSTLPELGELPLTEVKISAAAVARATASQAGAEAFTATAQALREQGVNVICDGCDSADELAVAVAAGCRRAQGTVVGPAMAPEQVGRWLATWTGVG